MNGNCETRKVRRRNGTFNYFKTYKYEFISQRVTAEVFGLSKSEP
jgi:hypothetical protein